MFPIILFLASISFFTQKNAAADTVTFDDDKVCIAQGCFHIDRKADRDLLALFFQTETNSETYANFSTKQKTQLYSIENTLLKEMDSANREVATTSRNTLLEIHRAFTLENGDPFEEGFELTEIPRNLLKDHLNSTYIKGSSPSTTNKSLFQSWEPRGEIKKLDLFAGKRSSRPANFNFDTDICTYSKPKTGSGTRPGFKAICGGTKVKLKFKEVHSHPFASRILWALGYSVAPADYVPHVTLTYDRKIFTEINSREGVFANLKFKGHKVKRIHFNPKQDMVNYIAYFTLKTGEKRPADELHSIIGNEKEEEKVATVTTSGTQIQTDDPNLIQIGKWSYNDFDHPDDRGIRALALPLAWIGGWDFRQDNNSLAIEIAPGTTPKFEFLLPDLGSALGSARSSYVFLDTIESLKGFNHTIARKHHLTRFTTIQENEAFKNCTREDAKWMIGLMSELDPSQIETALRASGYDGEELEKFKTILLKRLDQLKKAYH